MPIFSNRSIVRMLRHVGAVLGSRWERESLRRLDCGGKGAVAAEWEIAAAYSLSQEGDVRAVEPGEGVTNPDLVYGSRVTGASAVVEITAVSDASLHDSNPIEAFNERLSAVFRKNGLHAFGGTDAQIGYIDSPKGPILGVPARSEMVKFFASREFREFLGKIKADTKTSHVLRFQARGAHSRIEWRPGRGIGTANYLSHTDLLDPNRNPIVNRLWEKNRQVRESKLALPAIVILCDANCRILSTTMQAVGRPTLEQVISQFLGGSVTGSSAPGKPRARTGCRHINTAVLWSLQEKWSSPPGGPAARRCLPRILRNPGPTYYPASDDLISEVAGACRHLPSIDTMPINALRQRRRPLYYGGMSMSGGDAKYPLKLKFSLLTLQRMLAGEISYEEFARDHPDIVQQIRRVNEAGRMISNVRIEQTERDDDWIEFVFGSIAPEHLFKHE